MVEFKTERVTERITRIFAPSGELMYLVEGEKQAALIDTGSGIGSLKYCIDQLTEKPVIVLITHGHIDHAMGAAEFDEVYMNLVDDYIYNEHSDETFRKGGLSLDDNTNGITEADFIPSLPIGAFKDLRGGDSFDLGGETIEIYDCPGHTKGSVVMLMVEERIILLGDACNNFTFMFDDYSLTITAYQESLKKLTGETKGKYDRVLLSHGDGNGFANQIEGVIQVCDDILAGNTDDAPFEFFGRQALIAKALNPSWGRMDGGVGNIVYDKARI